MLLERLNQINDVSVYAVSEKRFETYGRIITGYDFFDMITYIEENTAIPDGGNVYEASVPGLEQFPVFIELQNNLYGGMEIQAGYCNGQNSTYNGFEYHKGSEVNIAVTDFMIVLGHTWLIQDNTYQIEDAEVFFVEKGTAFEMYQTTLHLSPCKISAEGFRDIVILPRGTNTPLTQEKRKAGGEGRLLLQKNKWVIAHRDREPLIRQGAYPGLKGENKELYY